MNYYTAQLDILKYMYIQGNDAFLLLQQLERLKGKGETAHGHLKCHFLQARSDSTSLENRQWESPETSAAVKTECSIIHYKTILDWMKWIACWIWEYVNAKFLNYRQTVMQNTFFLVRMCCVAVQCCLTRWVQDNSGNSGEWLSKIIVLCRGAVHFTSPCRYVLHFFVKCAIYRIACFRVRSRNNYREEGGRESAEEFVAAIPEEAAQHWKLFCKAHCWIVAFYL